ncbi:MAG: adenylate/guanylate cyclase domain-containing protein [Acidimicrobiia bacterium]
MAERQELPLGTVTFVFSDVEGSTRLLQSLGDGYSAVLERHHAIIENAVDAAGGVVVKIEGDGLFVAFRSAVAAVTCAADIQRALGAESWPHGHEVRVRIGIHTGEGKLGGGDYVGIDVHRAARIAAGGHGGQIVLSEATARLTEYSLPEGTFLEDLGSHALKDLVHEEHLYQLSISGLPREFPPLSTTSGVKGNLPQRTFSFIGRRDEARRAADAVGEHRLVTLTGSAGVGKTSLALAVAPQVSGRFPDGIWLVEVLRVVDEAMLAAAVARQLRITENPSQDMVDTLAARLSRASALLILDGCEHLIDAVAGLAQRILESSTDVHILVTSREWLAIRGEMLIHVAPMAVPASGARSIAELSSYDSVALFVERARVVQPGFQITPENGALVAEICRRLDGIPLAIELAAARLKMLSPWQLVERLDQQFALLTGRDRDVPPHQQTLETTLDWSHDSLAPIEQLLFARLSVFSGGFSLEAAEDVCPGGEVGRGQVLDLLGRLVETSLLEAAGTDPIRYRLLEPVGHYARRRLEVLGETDVYRRRHARFFTQLAEEADRRLHGLQQKLWSDRLDRDRYNLRSALGYLEEAGEPAEVLRLAGALRWYWVIRRDVSEGWSRLEGALTNRGEAAPEVVARALNGLGLLAIRRFDFERARAALTESRELYRSIGDGRGEARQVYHLATLAWFRDATDEADVLADEAEEMSRRFGDQWGLAWTLAMRGTMARLSGDLAEARRFMDESHQVFLRHTGTLDQGWSLLRLGALARDEGDYQLAARCYAEGRDELERAGDPLGVAHADAGLGAMAWLGGNHEHALSLYRSVLEGFSLSEEASNNLFELKTMIQGNPSTAELQAIVEVNRDRAKLTEGQVGARAALGEYLLHVGLTALRQTELERGRSALAESLALCMQAGDLRGVVLALRALATAFHASGDHETAVSMLGAGEAILGPRAPSEVVGGIPTDEVVADARDSLGEQSFTQAWNRGSALGAGGALVLTRSRTIQPTGS